MKKIFYIFLLVFALAGCTAQAANSTEETKETIAYLQTIAPEGSEVTYENGTYEVALARTGIRLSDTEGWETFKQTWLDASAEAQTLNGEDVTVHLTYEGDTVLTLNNQDVAEFTPIDCGCGI